MVNRFVVWLSAGVLAAGMSAAMLANAGVALADDGSSSDTGGSSSSESSSNSADSTKDSPDTAASAVAGAQTSGPTATRTTGGPPRTRVGARRADDATVGAKKPDATDATDRKPDLRRPVAGRKDAADTAAQETGSAPVDAPAAAPAKEDDSPVNGGDAVDVATNEETGIGAGVVEEEASDETPEEVVAEPRSSRDHGVEQTVAALSSNVTRLAADEHTAVRMEADESATTTVVDTEFDTGVHPAEERTAVVLDEPAETLVGQDFVVQPVAYAAPLAATTATAPQMPTLIRVIGTIVFDLYALATRIFGGPPILPANSTVTVRSSTLRIDCACAEGEGKEVPADWYIPKTAEGDPPPDRLIYLQHGFLASGPWYSHTAAALAERTNSIVVAPTITSNFFALDGCWLGGAPMHEAMAGLFRDGNTALAESAHAAGYDGPIPDRVVLMGHSLGGGAVSGMAGQMAGDARVDRLAGVVLLDGVALGDPARMTESLKKVPLDIPIYQLAAPVYMWNNFGAGLDALAAARPTGFIGVTLVNGSHVDSMRGGNPLIQFAQELVAGFTRPENAAAAQMLMVGWVSDMFDPTGNEGIYLERGQQFSFDTPAGKATVVALPNTLTKPYLLNFLRPFMSLANGFFSLEPVCVRGPVGSAGAGHCSDAIAA